MAEVKYDWRPGDPPPVLEPHSRAKHDLLRAYLASYIRILIADPRRDVFRFTLVDGFAGGGLYGWQGGVAPGSPLILLEEVARARLQLAGERLKPPLLDARFIFVEQRRASHDHLRHVLLAGEHRADLGGAIHLLRGSFEEELDGIIARIASRDRAQRCIFVLDQYGYSEVPLGAARRIMTELANPEIILTFGVDVLVNYLSEREPFLKAVVPVELGLRQVQELLALKDQSGGRWVIENLLYQHVVRLSGARYYTPFFVRSPESNRAYWLLHMSKHHRARDEMAVQHWAMPTRLVHHGKPGLQMLGYDPGHDPRQQVFAFDAGASEASRSALISALPPLIKAWDGAGGPLTLESLFARVANETPATRGMVADSLVELRDAREIELVSKDGRPKPRSGKVEWGDTVLLPRQPLLFFPTR